MSEAGLELLMTGYVAGMLTTGLSRQVAESGLFWAWRHQLEMFAK